MTIKIGVIGDFQAESEPHVMTQTALSHSGKTIATDVVATWLPTDALELHELDLTGFDGFWCATGSPYKSLNGALAAIKFAREKQKPFIGTCGGCQHAILEIARNVLGMTDAHHEEYDPYASTLFVSRLVCSLAGQEMQLQLQPDSMAHDLYGGIGAVTERYYCNFGLARKYESQLQATGFRISGLDQSARATENAEDSQGRIFELAGHPFFLATLFVPQMRSTEAAPHPLVTGFVAACAKVPAKQ